MKTKEEILRFVLLSGVASVFWTWLLLWLRSNRLLKNLGFRFLAVVTWVLAGAAAKALTIPAGIPSIIDLFAFPLLPSYMEQTIYEIGIGLGMTEEAAGSVGNWGWYSGFATAVLAGTTHIFLWSEKKDRVQTVAAQPTA